MVRDFLRAWSFGDKEVGPTCNVALAMRSEWKGASDAEYGKCLA